MSVEANKQVVRSFLEDVVNTGAVDRLADLISPDYREEGDKTGASSGLEGAKRHVLLVRQTYSDLHVTVEQQIAEGEWVATRITARGTHSGTWLGMTPTGRRVVITGVNIDRVVNGRIVEHGGAANLLDPLLAIGAIQVTGARQTRS
jgi:predicted ester cyclase